MTLVGVVILIYIYMCFTKFIDTKKIFHPNTKHGGWWYIPIQCNLIGVF